MRTGLCGRREPRGRGAPWPRLRSTRPAPAAGVTPLVGAVAGTLAPSLRAGRCAARAVAAIHGDADAYVAVQSADETAAWYGRAHGCAAAATSHPAADVRRDAHRGCANGTRLDYWRVAGGGHTLPGAPLVWSGLGPTSAFDGFGAICSSWEEARAAGPEAAVAPPGAGLIAGLVVGALLLLLAAVAAGIVVSRRRRRRPGKSPDADGLAVSAEAI